MTYQVSLPVRNSWMLIVRQKKLKVAQSCLTLCDPMDYSLPGSSVHGILQAVLQEWVAVPFSSGSFQPRDQSQVSLFASRFFTIWATRETQLNSKQYTNISGVPCTNQFVSLHSSDARFETALIFLGLTYYHEKAGSRVVKTSEMNLHRPLVFLFLFSKSHVPTTYSPALCLSYTLIPLHRVSVLPLSI